MEEVMEVLISWIKSSKSRQEMEMKISLIFIALGKIKKEFLEEREGKKNVH